MNSKQRNICVQLIPDFQNTLNSKTSYRVVAMPVSVHTVTHTHTLGCLLGSGEGQLQVVFVICWIQCAIIKLQREEGVDQSTESHPITPAG